MAHVIGENINLIINGRDPVDMRASGFVDDLSSEEFQSFIVQIGDVLSNEDFIVSDFKIDNPYPNPFNPQTSLNINIPISGNMSISVYDVSGNLIDVLHDERHWAQGILINAGAYTHYSYAIRDAIAAISIPTVEVHLTDTDNREEFRKNSVLESVCTDLVLGLGKNSYLNGLKTLLNTIK